MGLDMSENMVNQNPRDLILEKVAVRVASKKMKRNKEDYNSLLQQAAEEWFAFENTESVAELPPEKKEALEILTIQFIKKRIYRIIAVSAGALLTGTLMHVGGNLGIGWLIGGILISAATAFFGLMMADGPQAMTFFGGIKFLLCHRRINALKRAINASENHKQLTEKTKEA